jgi:hypothetical protein
MFAGPLSFGRGLATKGTRRDSEQVSEGVAEMRRVTEATTERYLSDGFFTEEGIHQIPAAVFQAPQSYVVSQRIPVYGEHAMEVTH